MFYKSKTCNYQTHLLKIALITIAVVENGDGTNCNFFFSNILLLINYDGSAEKFSYSISILVPSVTANIEMTPACDWITHGR